MQLGLRPVNKKNWLLTLKHCKVYDVEEGETFEYMYSVRESTLSLVIWTQEGWREGWYQYKVFLKNTNARRSVLVAEKGTAPEAHLWNVSDLEDHLRTLIYKVAPKERL